MLVNRRLPVSGASQGSTCGGNTQFFAAFSGCLRKGVFQTYGPVTIRDERFVRWKYDSLLVRNRFTTPSRASRGLSRQCQPAKTVSDLRSKPRNGPASILRRTQPFGLPEESAAGAEGVTFGKQGRTTPMWIFQRGFGQRRPGIPPLFPRWPRWFPSNSNC